MASNGISTLAFKRDRQNAKLAAASAKRATTERRSTLDATQLPTQYGVDSNAAEDIVDNENSGGLQTGRPWT